MKKLNVFFGRNLVHDIFDFLNVFFPVLFQQLRLRVPESTDVLIL